MLTGLISRHCRIKRLNCKLASISKYGQMINKSGYFFVEIERKLYVFSRNRVKGRSATFPITILSNRMFNT